MTETGKPDRTRKKGTILQVALDITEIDRAVQIASEAVAGGADWLEAGTPLIKSEGMAAVRTLHAMFPGREIVADMKIADTGALEVEMAAKAGASVVCILAGSDDAVIAEAVRAADLYGIRLMGDLISVPDPVARSRELEQMGVHIVNVHVGIDQQMSGKSPLDVLSAIRDAIAIPLAAAGGLDATTAPQAAAAGADIVIVGSAITKSADVTASARMVREALDNPTLAREKRSLSEDIVRDILSSVSTPNISDAMHRKGAMAGIIPLCGEARMAGRAVTVQGFAGDWAKPVEAIDIAEPGDVLVINNDGATHVACWGELATMSAMKRRLSGVVIDGAARDIDDIRRLGFPVFARAVTPNAGEPKGFGEINAEVRCGGQTVRPGDWIAGDASGVVVIPRERAAEIARRALEVKKTEERIREEIRRGSTLSRVSDLIRWEKK